jgi:hypothetical protein
METCLLLRSFTESLLVITTTAEPVCRAVIARITRNQASTFNTLLLDSVHLATFVIVIAGRTNTLPISTNVPTFTLAIDKADRRRRHTDTAALETDLIFFATIGIVFTLRDNLFTATELAAEVFFAVPVDETVGRRR